MTVGRFPRTLLVSLILLLIVVPGVQAPASASRAGTPAAQSPATVVVENKFVSSVGWVKPGDTYPFRVFVKNFSSTPAANVRVTLPVVDGTTFTQVTPSSGSGTADISNGVISWNVGLVPAGSAVGPTVKTLVVEARADTLTQDPTIVWKDISSTANLTYLGGPAGLSSTSHGPKVIPPKDVYNTARYGDRPFPVIPVDYRDRKHQAKTATVDHSGQRLSDVINSPDVKGSTFNLFQEMSYGQLFPQGTVPSADIGTKAYVGTERSRFTAPQPQGTCKGTTLPQAQGTPLYPARIQDGWYQLPGDTEYYGGDKTGTAIVGAVAGIGALQDIDSACGPTGKAVYDAAHVADPEIDYSDYDTDKDGVVDFFMMVFAGLGGNGDSQINGVPPYDNIWPHSSSLEFYYVDPATGLKGYISDDQLKDLQGRPLYYTNAARSTMTTVVTQFPVMVRVGPYNVNPESAIDHASVISHEYGHSLGLPDFYSTGTRDTYGDWNLMATDKSQHMDVFSKQELGWLIPRVLGPGETRVSGWKDSKLNTHRIDWTRPNGTPYTLSGSRVNNGEAYVAKLPSRKIIEPDIVKNSASADHIWWSQSGNDFGCPPMGGHNLDLFLPDLKSLSEGSQVSLTFKSLWDIEWDYDYGYVMISTDGGETYQSLPSAKGYTTPSSFNPNTNGCQTQYGNGITGTSKSYEQGTQTADRAIGNYPAPDKFLDDQYDLSAGVGKDTVLRFSYATDPGLARPGWFIDNLKITAGDKVLYETNFEQNGGPDDPRVFNGGCKESIRIAANCTPGWQYVSASAGSPADHAYYMEMRDRSGFEAKDGHGQSDRGDLQFLPGLLLVYTDEAHGYGNVGTSNPPAQTPIDSQPEPGSDSPDLNDAAYTAAPGDKTFTDFKAKGGHEDNYDNPSRADGKFLLDFDCLEFTVESMSGNGIGPATSPGDLQGTVLFNIGPGCGAFDNGSDPNNPQPSPNMPPDAVAQARPATTQIGEPVQFDASTSSDDRQTSRQLTYEWDFDGDGTFDASGQTIEHVYNTSGTYQAKLRVTDAGGLTDIDTVAITVLTKLPPPPANQAPNAVATVRPANATVGQAITFSGRNSTDDRQSANQLQYRWDFDANGTFETSGQTVSRTFRTAGTYQVTLQVTDAEGLSDTAQATVHVSAQPSTTNRVLLPILVKQP